MFTKYVLLDAVDKILNEYDVDIEIKFLFIKKESIYFVLIHNSLHTFKFNITIIGKQAQFGNLYHVLLENTS